MRIEPFMRMTPTFGALAYSFFLNFIYDLNVTTYYKIFLSTFEKVAGKTFTTV